jgi:hypothetical protein
LICPSCGAALPESARFCLNCGRPTGSGNSGPAPSPPPAPAAARAVSASPEAVRCPSCGAPLNPLFGEMVISCDYCGTSVALGGAGWKEISKHTLLKPTVTTPETAERIVRDFLDTGLMHRHAFEESKVVEQKLSLVPFWILPTSASTSYAYTDVAVGVGTTVGSIAAAELLGNALGGGRGGFVPMPMFMGSPMNSSREATISGVYEFPVVAVKAMAEYQPKNYEFALQERTFFDRTQIPEGTPVLNGDLGEDAAEHAARAYVMQLQAEQAHHRHRMVSRLNTQVEVGEGELVHVPIWYLLLDRKGQKSMLLIDAHAGRMIPTVVGS